MRRRGRDLHIAHLLRAHVNVIVLKVIEIEVGVAVAVGEERPGQVHSCGGESATADTEKQRHHDAEHILGAVSEGVRVES